MPSWVPDWVMLHDKLWVTLLAWFGFLFVPALILSLWLPDLAERFRRPRAHRRERRNRINVFAALAALAEGLVLLAAWVMAKVMRLGKTGVRRDG